MCGPPVWWFGEGLKLLTVKEPKMILFILFIVILQYIIRQYNNNRVSVYCNMFRLRRVLWNHPPRHEGGYTIKGTGAQPGPRPLWRTLPQPRENQSKWYSTAPILNPLTPNDHYSGRSASPTSKRRILYIYSTNIGTEYFKNGIYSPCFPLQNAVCFIILTYLVPVLLTVYIQGVLKFK